MFRKFFSLNKDVFEEFRKMSIKFFFSRKFVRDRDKWMLVFLSPQLLYMSYRVFEPDDIIHQRYYVSAVADWESIEHTYYNPTNKDVWDILQSEDVINFPR